jgi:sporulation protein YlmC with PRC-barrel domain
MPNTRAAKMFRLACSPAPGKRGTAERSFGTNEARGGFCDERGHRPVSDMSCTSKGRTMKRLLLTTAIAAALTGSAMAQTSSDELFRSQQVEGEIRASDLIGTRIYASEQAVSGDSAEGLQDGWEDIGEVNDVILSTDGSVQAVLVDIGGFLGMGERQVAVQMSALRILRDDATDADDFFLVMNANRGILEEAPMYGMDAVDGDGAQADPNQTGVTAGDTATAGGAVSEPSTSTGGLSASQQEATAEGGLSDDQPPVQAEDPTLADQGNAGSDDAVNDAAGGTSEMAGEVLNEGAATPDAVEGAAPGTREGYASATPEMLTAENLTSAEVFDQRDERIGEVADLVLDDAGKITDVVIDVGGFLGIGEKRVALPMGEVEIMHAESNGALRVYVSQSEEQLEQMPAVEIEG